MIDIYNDEKSQLVNWDIVTPDIMLIETKNMQNLSIRNNNSNVYIASFTTSYARIKLHNMLHLLGPRVLYFDTGILLLLYYYYHYYYYYYYKK